MSFSSGSVGGVGRRVSSMLRPSVALATLPRPQTAAAAAVACRRAMATRPLAITSTSTSTSTSTPARRVASSASATSGLLRTSRASSALPSSSTVIMSLAASRRALSTGAGKPLFTKILIANRGEIACRVMKTCKRLGIKTVAIYSEPDRNSVHVKMADEAICVGPAASKDSYLSIPRIVAAAVSTGAQAVHPGYGFLSEKVEFQVALEKAGIKFIGPKARALTEMGDKIASKQLARAAGVNTIPGDTAISKNAEEVIVKANAIGYPVMVKAAHGGGGKGMRIAYNDQEARDGFRLSTQEAMSSFASDAVFVEKFIEEPRHIEIQILADSHGNAVYVHERECSIQRRNQKVIEEAPSTFLDAATRKAMGEQAVALAKAVQYETAGTVEFLVDKHRKFYFLEMNTRLQVEHPVSEEISGLDLVEHMIRVTAGLKLPFTQEQVPFRGWALESRVYAEDPLRGFLPSIGRLKRYVEPVGEGVRCDSGIEEGAAISIYYDPMICKLITTGATRDIALQRMRKALDSYVIRGVTHNINFLRALCDHPRFISGAINTNFIPEEYPKGFKGHVLTAEEKRTLVAAALILYSRTIANQVTITGKVASFNAEAFHKSKLHDLAVTVQGEKFVVTVDVQQAAAASQSLVVNVGGASSSSSKAVATTSAAAPISVQSAYQIGDIVFDAVVDGSHNTLQLIQGASGATAGLGSYIIQLKGTEFDVQVQTALQQSLSKHMPVKEVIDTSKIIQSPMPGAVFSVSVKKGDKVAAGQEVCVLEAMKMQNALRALNGGIVKEVRVKPGQTVARDEVLIELE